MTAPHKRPVLLFRYSGGSMWPLFQQGDLVEVEKVSAASLRVGDCVIFTAKRGSSPIIHRVVAVKPEIITQGDNRANRDDEPLREHLLIGRVVAKIRGGRKRTVHGGLFGKVVGKAVRLAALIDPRRPTRGGMIARFIRSHLQGVGWRLHQRSLLVQYKEGREQTWRLVIGADILAEWKAESSTWEVNWPYLLFLAPHTLLPPRRYILQLNKQA